jgi:hypothetical protein
MINRLLSINGMPCLKFWKAALRYTVIDALGIWEIAAEVRDLVGKWLLKYLGPVLRQAILHLSKCRKLCSGVIAMQKDARCTFCTLCIAACWT